MICDMYDNTIILLRTRYYSCYKLIFSFCVLLLHSPIKEFNRQKLEEAIAALLVLPVPQNLLIQKSSLDKMPPNALPVDNLLIVSRFLGTTLFFLFFGTAFFSRLSKYTACLCFVQQILMIVICILPTESLGEPCVDGNNQFFSSPTVKTKGMQQLRQWTLFYPQGM